MSLAKKPGEILEKDRSYIRLAKFIAGEFSKCLRAKYATVWVGKHGHLIGASWNGKPKGVDCDALCFRNTEGATQACCLHAEDNGCSWTDALHRQGGTVYVSGIPCDMCLLRLLNSGVGRIVYLAESDTSRHKCNIVIPGGEFCQRYDNGTEVVAYTDEEWEKLYQCQIL